jgi:hypothetical protein
MIIELCSDNSVETDAIAVNADLEKDPLRSYSM